MNEADREANDAWSEVAPIIREVVMLFPCVLAARDQARWRMSQLPDADTRAAGAGQPAGAAHHEQYVLINWLVGRLLDNGSLLEGAMRASRWLGGHTEPRPQWHPEWYECSLFLAAVVLGKRGKTPFGLFEIQVAQIEEWLASQGIALGTLLVDQVGVDWFDQAYSARFDVHPGSQLLANVGGHRVKHEACPVAPAVIGLLGANPPGKTAGAEQGAGNDPHNIVAARAKREAAQRWLAGALRCDLHCGLEKLVDSGDVPDDALQRALWDEDVED